MAAVLMRIYKTRHFTKWARKHSIGDGLLVDAVNEMTTGLIDADYGGDLYKKRIATRGRGKSGSVRTLLALRVDERAYFLYGFEKNEQSNINVREKRAYKALARSMLAFNKEDLEERLKAGSLIEVEL